MTQQVTITNRFSLGFDVILFALFGFAATRLAFTSLLVYFLLAGSTVYFFGTVTIQIVFDIITITGSVLLIAWPGVDAQRFPRRRFVMIVTMTGMLVLSLFLHRIYIRDTHQPWNVTHDGALQTEIAARALIHGHNPYTINFRGTILDHVKNSNIPDQFTLFTHYAYPPLQFLLAVPIVWLGDHFGFPPDTAAIQILILAAAAAMLVWQTKSWRDRSLIWLLTFGNPLLYLYAIAGYNDTLFAGLLIIMAALANRRKWLEAGIVFGLALAAKQTAWLVIPLWGWWLWQQAKDSDQSERRRILNSVIMTVGVTGLLYVPFAAWNFSALYDSLVRFVSGTITGSYPISGSSLWQFLILFSRHPDVWRQVPSGLIQLLIGLPLLWYLARRLLGNSNASTWLTVSVIFITSLSLFNRYFYDNYFSSILLLLIGAWALRSESIDTSALSQR